MIAPLLRVEVPREGYHRRLISCQQACPVGTDARGYVRAIAESNFEEAYLIARGPNPFASICGRVCGAPCEAACRRGTIPRVGPVGEYPGDDRPISIRALKRIACEKAGVDSQPTDRLWELVRSFVPRIAAGGEEIAAMLRASVTGRIDPGHGEKVAIVGAGPAGLSAAHDLALLGLKPTVYETEAVPAGMLALGVPGYRLPRELIRREVAMIEALGVDIQCGITIGKEVSFRALRSRHAAVILAVGAKRPRSLGLPGEAGPGVFGGVDLLRAAALGEPFPLGRSVVVIGGGNVAYDVARTVLRQAASDAARTAARFPGPRRVFLVSLETLDEMPADTVEIREGDEEGIVRLNGWGPVAIERDGAEVRAVRFRRCVRAYDEQRRFAPVFDDTSMTSVECDTVLLAVGQATDLSFLDDGGAEIEQARPGWPRIDPASLATTAPGVFVAGDLAHGTRLLIDAVASGKKAARSVYTYLTGHPLVDEIVETHTLLERYRRENGYEAIPRVEVPTIPPEDRLSRPDALVELGYDAAGARREASRCLDCGVTPVFDGARCILCGGCADVCPTSCLKLVTLDRIEPTDEFHRAVAGTLGSDADMTLNTAILKDEGRCIRCALCVMRCPADAIAMERVSFETRWRCV